MFGQRLNVTVLPNLLGHEVGGKIRQNVDEWIAAKFQYHSF